MNILKIEGEETFFGVSVSTPEEFIKDLCERIDKVYTIVIEEESKTHQLAYIIGFLRAFKGRLNRVCEKPYKIFDFKLIEQKYIQKDVNKLMFEGEETFSAEKINTPEEFIEDFCNRIDILYAAAMEEEHEMSRLAYLITSSIVLKGRLNRVCVKM